MTLDDLDAYEQAKLAGTVRIVLIGGQVFIIDTRTAKVGVTPLDRSALTQRRQELVATRQTAVARAQAIKAAIDSLDILIADIAEAPTV